MDMNFQSNITILLTALIAAFMISFGGNYDIATQTASPTPALRGRARFCDDLISLQASLPRNLLIAKSRGILPVITKAEEGDTWEDLEERAFNFLGRVVIYSNGELRYANLHTRYTDYPCPGVWYG